MSKRSAGREAAKCDADVSKRLNELFANDLGLAKELAQASNEIDATGADWSGERW